MKKEQFLKGQKRGRWWGDYVVSFKNIYTMYIEKEERSRLEFCCDNMLDEEAFDELHGENWNARWFYIGDNILPFCNEMGWDLEKIAAGKKLQYSSEHGVSYKNYVIQDIWEPLSKEISSETFCWGIANLIEVLHDTKEQRAFKSSLQEVMSELYQPVEEEKAVKGTAGILMQYVKENKGVECAFGHIEIDTKNGRLGQGGNGIVYSGGLAEMEVAVKFLVNYDRKKLDRFKAEYINVSIVKERLRNTVNYLHYETLKTGSTEIPFIVMKKYKMSLRQQRSKMEESKWPDLLKLFEDLCAAVKSLEENDIIHRDLKPENILVDENGNYIITDFGIAHFESDQYPIKGITRKNDRMANWEFSAPEQIMAENITAATDIYALGQILYWFCFGNVNRGTGGKHLTEIFDEEKAAVLDGIIYKALSNAPEDRYQNILEIEKEYEK